jgi:hypothetical protein
MLSAVEQALVGAIPRTVGELDEALAKHASTLVELPFQPDSMEFGSICWLKV